MKDMVCGSGRRHTKSIMVHHTPLKKEKELTVPERRYILSSLSAADLCLHLVRTRTR